MAHIHQVEPFYGAAKNYGVTYTVDAIMEIPVIVMDDEWEEQHEAWLGFHDRLAIACGCQKCADAIYKILTACAIRNGKEGIP